MWHQLDGARKNVKCVPIKLLGCRRGCQRKSSCASTSTSPATSSATRSHLTTTRPGRPRDGLLRRLWWVVDADGSRVFGSHDAWDFANYLNPLQASRKPMLCYDVLNEISLLWNPHRLDTYSTQRTSQYKSQEQDGCFHHNSEHECLNEYTQNYREKLSLWLVEEWINSWPYISHEVHTGDAPSWVQPF